MIDFDSSCLICAHPDDEVIYFGSLLEKVTSIVLIYLVDPQKIYEKRIQFINQHPLKHKIIYVMMDESGCFQINDASGNKIECVDWKTTKPTKYGIQFRDGVFVPKYFQNYSMIKEILQRNISKFKTVITHNPWAESEHAEHAQVFQIIKQLQEEFSYRLYYTNYIHWTFEDSVNYANRIISNRNIMSYPEKIDIDVELCKSIKKKYVEHNIWSGHPQIEWDQKYDILYEDSNYPDCKELMKIRPLMGSLPTFSAPKEEIYPNIF